MNWKKFWKERQSTIASGVAALIIIAIGFLLFNSASDRNDNEQDLTKDQKQEDQSKEQDKTKDQDSQKEATSLPTKYTVQRGDYLSQIAAKYYGDGNKWTVIASENKLANPNVIHTGNILSIPKLEMSAVDQKGTVVSQEQSYTVARGDSLWTISEKYYGTGYEWYRLHDANKDKIGLLANGRPLILPGQILKIPPKS